MKNLSLTISILFFSIYFLGAQEIHFSVLAKANHVFSKIENRDIFPELPLDLNIASAGIKLIGKTGYEIGVNCHLQVDEKMQIVTGIHYQHVQYKTEQFRNDSFVNTNASPVFVDPDLLFASTQTNALPRTTTSLSYIKIPILVNLDIFRSKIFLQTGIFGSFQVNSNSVRDSLVSFRENPFSEGEVTIIIVPANPEKQIRKQHFGFQLGTQYRITKKWSIEFDYSRTLNNFFREKEDTDIENRTNDLHASINNLSLGVRWMIQ